MATGSSRDERVNFIYDVVGDKDVAAAAATMLQTADAAGEAGTQVDKFKAELSDLASQAKLVATAIDQKAELAETANQYEIAQQKAATLAATLERTGATAKQVNAAYAASDAELARLTAQYASQDIALQKSIGSLQRAGIDTNNLSAANAQLRTRANEAASGLAAMAGASKETAVGFGEIAEKSTVLSRIVDTVKELAVAFAGLFVLDKVKESLTEIIDTGERFDDLDKKFATAFGSVSAGAEALEKVKTLAEGTPQGFEDIAAAAIKLKQAGFDPLDGTLQALVDNANALNQSQDQLIATIDALGKANVKGVVNMKALVSLSEQGVPVFDLLGTALGKSADEVRDMGNAGQLGSESIKLLVTQLGNLRAGAAASELSDTDSQIRKIKDSVEEFFNTIAHSGALDYVRAQMKALNDQLTSAAKSGALTQAAKSISDAIVATGKGIVGVTTFLYDHAAALGVAVKAYVLFKGTLLTLDLAAAAAKFAGLAAATKEAGAAAEGIASDAGPIAKLNSKLLALPKAVQIAIAVEAVDFALTQVEKLITQGNEFYALQDRLKEQDAAIAAQREQLATKANAIADQLKGYADAQIASADQLAAQSRDQAQTYIDQLQNATRYYNALRIQAQTAGDSDGVAAATAKLQQLGDALIAANENYKTLNETLNKSSESVRSAVDHFDELRSSGTSTAEAIAGAFSKIEIRTPQGLTDVIAIIRQVAIRSSEARKAVEDELSTALQKLDESDLRSFQNNVTERLAAATGNANALRIALGAALQASLQNLGLSAQQAGVSVTESGEQMIATFNDVARNAQSSGTTIQLAFAQALAGAKTTGEVDALKEQLSLAFAAGKIGADQFGVAIQAAGRKTADIQADAAIASASLDGVGKAGQSAADRISGSLQDARDALIQQQNALSQKLSAALAENDKDLVDSLNSQVTSLGAQITELNNKIATIKTPDIKPPDLTHFQQGVTQIADGAQQASDHVGQFSDTASRAIKQMGEETGDSLEGVTADLSNFSDNARQAFADAQDAALKFGIANESALRQYVIAVDTQNAKIQASISSQQTAADALVSTFESMTDASLKSFSAQGNGLSQLSAELQTLVENAKAGAGDFSLLNDSDLSRVIQAAESAAQKVQEISDAAKQARADLQSIGDDLQDQIDQINGNQKDVEDRRFQNQLKQLHDEAEENDLLNDASYLNAVAKANQLHQLKLKQIADEANAQTNANSKSNVTTAPSNGIGNGTSPGGGGGGTINPPATTHTIEVNLNGTNVASSINPDNPQDLNRLGQKLLPVIINQIKTAARATGVFRG